MSFTAFSSAVNILVYILPCFLSLQLQSGTPATIKAASRMQGNETDKLALLAFKAQVVEDPFQAMSSWNASTHFCKWLGVTCGHRHQRVTILDLQSRKLVGVISPHLGNLSFLRVLCLQNNSFTGEIPPELGRLRRLQVLWLHNNSIGGSIPANLSGSSNLTIINLSKNKLVGNIPPELGVLPRLKMISINTNYLIGYLPSALGNLSSLQCLKASENNLVGSIPEALCQIKSLNVLSVWENSLSGAIPPPLFNHSSIIVIDVGNNHIEGTLPSQLGHALPSLEYLSIRKNNFIGQIPASISNATNLFVFQIAVNWLSGKVPTLEKLKNLTRFLAAFNQLGTGEANDLDFLRSLTNATNLELLELNLNKFRGVLPESVGNLSTSLLSFSLSENHFHGEVPAGICNLVKLQELYLADNNFTGHIPPEIGRLQNLRKLAFLGNNFSGTIPLSLGNLTSLTMFSLAQNQLHGSIPASIGKCQALVYLDLSHNNLIGTIPKEVFDLSSLSLGLDLSQNQFTGTVPMEVGKLKNLEHLNLNGNILIGEIPTTLGSCVKLGELYLQSNFFQGTIPSSFSLLRGIELLDLSHNNLSGRIPEYFKDFQLQNLNLSYNDFEGEVPTGGIFKNASAFSIAGNSNLCGGVPELQLPKCKTKGSKKRSSLSLKYLITALCGLVGSILVLCFVYSFWVRRRKKEPISASLEHELPRVSYMDLFKATDGFSSSNLIGRGSFGTVYRGIFSDGNVMAVKVLDLLHHGAFKSFIAECEALRNIRHRNLVKVLTACSGVDLQGNDFKALVCEFMVNGSLDEWLHPNFAERSLNLLQRLNIAIDIGFALDYLHHHSPTRIVHCDLKPSNVLLDFEMTAHVSDFGLAKCILEGSCDNSTNQTSSIGIRGTLGYAAPEYGMGSEVSTYGDVYSYGILLLEMLTGKRPTDEIFNENLSLHKFAKIGLSEGLEGIADPVLLGQGEEGKTSKTITQKDNCSHYSNSKILETLAPVFQIAIACSQELPRDRPDVVHVVTELQRIKDAYLRTSS